MKTTYSTLFGLLCGMWSTPAQPAMARRLGKDDDFKYDPDQDQAGYDENQGNVKNKSKKRQDFYDENQGYYDENQGDHDESQGGYDQNRDYNGSMDDGYDQSNRTADYEYEYSDDLIGGIIDDGYDQSNRTADYEYNDDMNGGMDDGYDQNNRTVDYDYSDSDQSGSTDYGYLQAEMLLMKGRSYYDCDRIVTDYWHDVQTEIFPMCDSKWSASSMWASYSQDCKVGAEQYTMEAIGECFDVPECSVLGAVAAASRQLAASVTATACSTSASGSLTNV